ncbi:MAG: hypothetical protein M1827_001610 [Pycnora praestabilis]|nr:MAG: hypothetical protein M1827_001610 [Pycnora praestabilis]
MALTPASRAQLQKRDRWHIPKISLRLLATILSIIGLIMFAWAMSNTTPEYTTPYDEAYYLLPWVFIGLGLSILWNTATLTTYLTLHRPIHPGAHVALDLIIWLALLTTGIIAIFGAISDIQYNVSNININYDLDSSSDLYTYPNGTSYYDTYNVTSETYDTTQAPPCAAFAGNCKQQDAAIHAVQHKGVVDAAGCGIVILAALLHLALFVWACRDTDVRNKSRANRRAVRIAQDITAGMAQRGQPPGQGGQVPSEKQGQYPLLSLGTRDVSRGASPSRGARADGGRDEGVGYYAPSQAVEQDEVGSAAGPSGVAS